MQPVQFSVNLIPTSLEVLS